ncbi:MAG: class I SAM-dependent methyltransferase [Actinomycetota bacterium]|nr:class I SAM-dependent methyltransferase [Actinomycetota bacterium]
MPGGGLPTTPEWSAYYDAVEEREPREFLTEALGMVTAVGSAVDLGCGDGTETAELLRRGWRVLAIDAEADAIRRLRGRVAPADAARLETRTARFEDLGPLPGVDLVHAEWSLPFCSPASFPALWASVVGALHAGGVFAGQFFGDRDSWASEPDMTFHTEAQARELLSPLETLALREEENDDTDALGNPKHWHVFHVIARSPGVRET